jgi:hypothetical protein
MWQERTCSYRDYVCLKKGGTKQEQEIQQWPQKHPPPAGRKTVSSRKQSTVVSDEKSGKGLMYTMYIYNTYIVQYMQV